MDHPGTFFCHFAPRDKSRILLALDSHRTNGQLARAQVPAGGATPAGNKRERAAGAGEGLVLKSMVAATGHDLART